MDLTLAKKLANFKILYAEDEKGIQEEVKEILELLFYEVYMAKDGKEAYEIYKEKKPDLIITDIKMPRLTGIELAKYIRKIDDKTPIAITTAFTDVELMIQATELNLLKYIVKPVTKDKLSEIFKKFLEKINIKDEIKLNNEFTFFKKLSIIKQNETNHNLNQKEFTFLNHILNKKAIVTYEEIEYLLHIDSCENENAIRQFIKKLRKKLPLNYLKNIQNQGYIISSEYL